MPRLAPILALALAACGGGGGPPPGAVALSAWTTDPQDQFVAATLDTSCFGTAPSDHAQTVPSITFTTMVTDFQTKAALPMATVSAFVGTDQAATLGTPAMSDANGNLTFTIPSSPSHTRIGFKIQEDNSFDTFLLNQYFDPAAAAQSEPATISAVSFGTGAALPALVGVTRTPGTGVLAGALRDCQKHELAGFTATVSATPGAKAPVEGSKVYYFSDGGLPARNTVIAVANKNGLFTVLELPPTATAYVQMWGYLSDQDLADNNETLLSELAVPVLADNIITGSYELQRTGN